MPKTTLTKTVVDRAAHTGAGNQTIYQDTELPGLALRVTAGGVKSYVVEYRRGGRKRRVTLGRHGPLTVDQARQLAKRELYSVAVGETFLKAFIETDVVLHAAEHARRRC